MTDFRTAYENARATLHRSVVGGRVTWVREPRSPLAVTLWPFTQVLHAYALSDRVSGPARFGSLVRGLSGYRDPRGAYRESIGRGKRYYDDNAWVGLALLQRAEFDSGSSLRNRAAAIEEFLRNGFDPGTGGVRWVEAGDTINACSTGATALLRAGLGQSIGPELRFLAELRNADGLVRDHLRADGSVEPSVYSYNQGLLIAAAARAGDEVLAREACEAGATHFTPDRLWSQAVCFNAVYIKAQMRYGVTDHIVEYAQRLAADGRDDRGWYTQAGRYDNGSVLDTAGALQIFTLLAFGNLARHAT